MEASGDHHTERNRISSIGFVGAAASSAALLQNSRDKFHPLPLPRGQNLRKRGCAALLDLHVRAAPKRSRTLHRHRFDRWRTFSRCYQRGRHCDGRQHSHYNSMGRSMCCFGVRGWYGPRCEHDVCMCGPAVFVELSVLCPVQESRVKIVKNVHERT